jgi:hypothetical protein
MSAAILQFPKLKDDAKGRLAHMDKAVVLSLPPEVLMSAFCREAARAYTRSCEAVITGQLAVISNALSFCGLRHASETMRGAKPCRTERRGQNLAPGEGQ